MKPRGEKGRFVKQGRPWALTPDQQRDAARLYRTGWTLKQLAAHYGVGRSVIHRNLKAAEVKMRPASRPRKTALDPIWGKLAWLMYEPRDRREVKAVELRPGEMRVDLGRPKARKGSSSLS